MPSRHLKEQGRALVIPRSGNVYHEIIVDYIRVTGGNVEAGIRLKTFNKMNEDPGRPEHVGEDKPIKLGKGLEGVVDGFEMGIKDGSSDELQVVYNRKKCIYSRIVDGVKR